MVDDGKGSDPVLTKKLERNIALKFEKLRGLNKKARDVNLKLLEEQNVIGEIFDKKLDEDFLKPDSAEINSVIAKSKTREVTKKKNDLLDYMVDEMMKRFYLYLDNDKAEKISKISLFRILDIEDDTEDDAEFNKLMNTTNNEISIRDFLKKLLTAISNAGSLDTTRSTLNIPQLQK